MARMRLLRLPTAEEAFMSGIEAHEFLDAFNKCLSGGFTAKVEVDDNSIILDGWHI